MPRLQRTSDTKHYSLPCKQALCHAPPSTNIRYQALQPSVQTSSLPCPAFNEHPIPSTTAFRANKLSAMPRLQRTSDTKHYSLPCKQALCHAPPSTNIRYQ